jgi:predicted PurR-regulated permease PerM
LTFWSFALLALIAALWIFSGILLPFLAGLALAYFLDPIADGLERAGFSRLISTLIILFCSIFALILLLLLVLPIVVDQLTKLAVNLPGLASELIRLFENSAPQWLKDALAGSGTDVTSWLKDNAGRAAQWAAAVLTSVWSGGLALVNILSLIVVTPIVAFYLLNDWDHMVAIVDNCLPRQHLETIRGLARQIDAAMAGFIRGQGTVCLSLGVFYAVTLSLLGLNFGFVIGLMTGALSFIPYVGATVGGLTAIGVALVQFWPEPVPIVLVAAAFLAGQFLEGNFLSPRLVGNRIGLHPVWLMFALFAFGYLFGFVGLLVAVPLSAAFGVLIRFAIAQYMKSPLYLGVPAHAADAPQIEEKKKEKVK